MTRPPACYPERSRNGEFRGPEKRRPVRRAHAAPGSPPASRLARRLARHVEGPVRFDALARALYSTDASIYEAPPLGVVLPKTLDDVEAVLEVAREEGVPVLPRGAGTSQCGQTVGQAVVVDASRHLNRICEIDEEGGTATVEPGVVLDALNRDLAPSGLFFPVDVATASRATIGGMAGNNSGGARSIRYGVTADNVLAIEASLPEGGVATFGPGPAAGGGGGGRPWARGAEPGGGGAARGREIEARIREIAGREASELRRRVPGVARHVAGYNLHRMLEPGASMAEILVGSEGTLGFFRRITLKLARRPRRAALAICGFASLRNALDAVRHVVEMRPHAVELVDDEVLRLARENDQFRGAVETFAPKGANAVLLVEFAGEEREPLLRKLDALEDAFGSNGRGCGMSRAESAAAQDAVWSMRRAAMNIVMSAKGPRKPVSIVEDCAVPLSKLADYADAVTEIFARHGTRGTWYAHASVGCLHVRPSLDVRDPADLAALRAIAEETHAVVRRLGGSHSGEHGDGILRSEFIEPMLGARLARAFAGVKRAFDPAGLMNPGKIVSPPRMDDPALLRRTAGHGDMRLPVAAPQRRGRAAGGGGRAAGMDWSDTGGFAAAVQRCNNNGACRKTASGVMCPSFRVTREERDSTRGRANVLRLAMAGVFGAEELLAPEVASALDLCVACKACRRECPAGVDMARMKAEALHRRRRAKKRRGGGRRAGGGSDMAEERAATRPDVRMLRKELRQRLFAGLPRVALMASRFPWLFNLRNRSALLARACEGLLGVSAGRRLPEWRRLPFRDTEMRVGKYVRGMVGRGRDGGGNAVQAPTAASATTDSPTDSGGNLSRPRAALFVDTFHRYFEPEVARAAVAVLERLSVEPVAAVRGPPLCCGRTWIAAGLLEQGRAALARTVDALAPFVAAGTPIVGLEPSCLLTLREDAPLLVPGENARAVAESAVLLDEYLASPNGPLSPEPVPDPGHGARPATANADVAQIRERAAETDAARAGEAVAYVHGHCHQKAAGTDGATTRVIEALAGLRASPIDSTCCGMAGSFGYEAEHADVSRAMGELDLLPAARAAGERDWVVANGFSCRAQIRDGAGRKAKHVAVLLAERMTAERSRGAKPARW